MAGKNFDITKFTATLPPEGVPESGTRFQSSRSLRTATQ